MIRYFLRSLAAHFGAGRTLFALSVLGVALGVSSLLCIQIINRNALGAFEGSVRAISGEADFSILGRTPTLPETFYPRVLADPGVRGAWPIYRLDVALPGLRVVVSERSLGPPRLPQRVVVLHGARGVA